MDQLADALKFVAQLQAQALEPKAIHSDAEMVRVVINGQVHEYGRIAEPREHKAETVAEIVSLANRFKSQKPVVWYGQEHIHVTLDDGSMRLHHVFLTLQLSDVFQVLAGLRKAKECWKTQKDFVRMLRIDLAGTLEPSALLDAVRTLKIENGSTVTSTVAKNRESMGQSLSSKATTERDIPDEVTLEVPVFKTPGESHLRFAFRATVECDPTRLDCFRLLPYPDEVERVKQHAVTVIGERLIAELEEGIPAYQGRP